MPRFYVADEPPRCVPESEVAGEGDNVIFLHKEMQKLPLAKVGTTISNVVIPAGTRVLQARLKPGSMKFAYELATQKRAALVGWKAGSFGHAVPVIDGALESSAMHFALLLPGTSLVLDLDSESPAYDTPVDWLSALQAQMREAMETKKKKSPPPAPEPVKTVPIRRSRIEQTTTAAGVPIRRAVVEANSFEEVAAMPGINVGRSPVLRCQSIAQAVAKRCGLWAQAQGLDAPTVIAVEDSVSEDVKKALWNSCVAKAQQGEFFARIERGEFSVEVVAVIELGRMHTGHTIEGYTKIHRDRLALDFKDDIEKRKSVGTDAQIESLKAQVVELATALESAMVAMDASKQLIEARDRELAEQLRAQTAATVEGMGRAAQRAVDERAMEVNAAIARLRAQVLDERGEVRRGALYA